MTPAQNGLLALVRLRHASLVLARKELVMRPNRLLQVGWAAAAQHQTVNDSDQISNRRPAGRSQAKHQKGAVLRSARERVGFI